MPIALAVQYSVSRSLQYLVFFTPVLIIALYAIFAGIRYMGTGKALEGALLRLTVRKPKVLARKWDVSLNIDSAFLQPVAIAELEFPGASFKKVAIGICRHPGIPLLSRARNVWSFSAELPIRSRHETIYRLPFRADEKAVFAHFSSSTGMVSKAVSEASLDMGTTNVELLVNPLSVRLNDDSELIRLMASLSPSRLDILNSGGSARITMKLEAGEPGLNDAISALDSIARHAVAASG